MHGYKLGQETDDKYMYSFKLYTSIGTSLVRDVCMWEGSLGQSLGIPLSSPHDVIIAQNVHLRSSKFLKRIILFMVTRHRYH